MTLAADSFFDRRAYRLSNDHLALTIVPALSGRVMELLVGGRNHFWISEPLLAGRAGSDPPSAAGTIGGGYRWVWETRWALVDAPSQRA